MERYIEEKYLSGSVSVREEVCCLNRPLLLHPGIYNSTQVATGATGIVNLLMRQIPSESLSFVPGRAVAENRVFRLQAFRSRL